MPKITDEWRIAEIDAARVFAELAEDYALAVEKRHFHKDNMHFSRMMDVALFKLAKQAEVIAEDGDFSGTLTALCEENQWDENGWPVDEDGFKIDQDRFWCRDEVA